MSEEPENPDTRVLSIVELIRMRPAMYVGSTGMWGLVHYLVESVVFSLRRQATWISVSVGDLLQIHSDALVEKPLGQDFITTGNGYYDPRIAILAALSEQLTVAIHTPTQTGQWRFRQGALESETIRNENNLTPEVAFRFKPDPAIFEVTELSPAIFHSYFRRMSYLHRGVRFRFTTPVETREYHAPGGLRELFESIAAPCQYLHEPIHFTAAKGDLQMECLLAFQSWTENFLWCYINHGRTVDGGTHETGLKNGLRRLRKKLFTRKDHWHQNNGVIALVALQYPQVVFEGCIKGRVGNPELRRLVSDLVCQGTLDWLKQHPAVERQLAGLETFVFPEAWFH